MFTKQELKKMLYLSTSGYFEFNDEIYQQIDGVSMGIPLAPLLADAFMDSLEKRALSGDFGFLPRHYFRYVDDTLAIFDDDQSANAFLSHLNNCSPSIRFTMESSTDQSLPFCFYFSLFILIMRHAP